MQKFRQPWLWYLAIAVGAALIVGFVCWPLSVPAPALAIKPVANPFLPPHSADRGWPFIRGIDYDGRSPEIHVADEWPAAGPPVLWSRRLGQGYSAFVAGNDRVYTQAQTLAGQFVFCLHADTGETVWQHHYDWPYDSAGVYPGPRATPTLYNDAVYFAAPNGLIGCLDAASGEPRWSVNVLEKYGGRGVDFGYSCSPTVLEGRVILPVGGRGASLVALSAEDGQELWKAGGDSASYTPAFPVTHGGRKLVIGYLENAILCCDRATGEVVGRHHLSQGYDEHSAWPIYREPHLWTSGPFQSGSTLWRLSTEGDALKPVWSNELLSNDVMSSVLVDDHLYGFDIRDPQAKTHRTSRGTLRCINWHTGKLAWTAGKAKLARNEKPLVGHSSLIAADGKLILLNDLGELIVARANPDRYEELARAEVLPGEIVWTPPMLHRGRVYVRNHSQAVCVYVGRPDLLEASQRQQAKSVAELPRSWSGDWTNRLLPVEPEYAFDVPRPEWLIEWFAWCAAILIGVWCLVGIVASCARNRATMALSRSMALTLAGLGGALGTTLLSIARDDFIFTWPLALWAVFHASALQLPLTRRQITTDTRRRSLVAGLALGIASLAYFWLCRRLSLVFEWAFLAGYLPALMAVLLDRWVVQRSWPQWTRSLAIAFVSLLGFTIFYWSGVALLWFKY